MTKRSDSDGASGSMTAGLYKQSYTRSVRREILMN
jgi:hypothetical protein